MRAWLYLLGGMTLWFAHFMALYVLGSVFLTSLTARVGVALVTLTALGAGLWLLFACLRGARDPGRVPAWTARIGAVLTGGSLVAILWQALPAVIG